MVSRVGFGQKFLNRTDGGKANSEAPEFISGSECVVSTTHIHIYMCTRATEEDITVEITPGRAGIVGILCRVSAGRSTPRNRAPCYIPAIARNDAGHSACA